MSGKANQDFEAMNAHCLPRAGRRRDAPKLYSKKIVKKICDFVVEGKSTNEICKMKGMPNRVTLGKWLRKYPEFARQYLEAKQIQTYFNVDDIREIAEECDETSGPAVQKAKLRVDVLKWEATKMVPKIYGDKASLDIRDNNEVSTERMDEVVQKVLNKIKPATLIESGDIIDDDT